MTEIEKEVIRYVKGIYPKIILIVGIILFTWLLLLIYSKYYE